MGDPELEPSLSEIPPFEASESPETKRARVGRWARLLATFFTGQTLVQGLNLVTGFLLLRWMSVEAYAQYSVANSFQSTASVLVDMGMAGSVVALVGARKSDREVVGGYLRSARVFRGRMFFVMAAITAVAFPLIVQNQQWAWHVKALLWGAIMSAIFFSAWNVYGAPLLMHRKLGAYYSAQAVPAGLRLTLQGAAYAASVLTGWAASWINAISTLVGGWQMRRSSRGMFEEPPEVDPERLREMRNFVSPRWPGLFFYAFEAQFTIALITILGQTKNIAEVGALGRMAALATFISAGIPVLLQPKVAASPDSRVPKLLLFATLAWSLLAAIFGVFAFFWQEPFLFILGPKYDHLGPELTLVLISMAVQLLTSIWFCFNMTKKWITWRTSTASIVFVIVAQIVMALTFDVSTTYGIAAFTLGTSFAKLLTVGALCGYWGVLRTAGGKA
jgi:O-antigen/teichoic acid export membrane protein